MCLETVQSKLMSLGVTLTFDVYLKPFWTAGPSNRSTSRRKQHVPNVTYVDDVALLISASSSKHLWGRIPVTFEDIVASFRAFGFKLNWKPGKSEAFLIFRGKHAALYNKRVRDSMNTVKLPLGAGCDSLRIVESYTHVASVLSYDGSCNLDVLKRIASANASYAPLALKVFGASSVTVKVKLHLAESLVFSRLLYNVHLYNRFSSWTMRKLNATYMRVLRRIAGDTRHSKHVRFSDAEVRAMLGVSSFLQF